VTTVPHPPADETYQIDIRIVRLPRGGYVLAEIGEHGGPVQAVSNLNELVGALSSHVGDWNKDMDRLIKARFEDENPNVVEPKRWWRAVK
jgi:hypothetical protein